MQPALSFVHKISAQSQQNHMAQQPAATVCLTWYERQKSRLVATTSQNAFVAIVLPRGETLHHGDLLTTEDSAHVIGVLAQEEPLLKITAANSLALMKLVYHLANRHVKIMITADMIFIEPDPILQRMVVNLGGTVSLVRQAFNPEGGAYVHSSTHNSEHSGKHSHGHDQDHHHSHGGHGGHDLEPEDFAHGAIGEALSKLAHARK